MTSGNENEGASGVTPENKETVLRIATEIIEPALQKAFADAKKKPALKRSLVHLQIVMVVY